MLIDGSDLLKGAINELNISLVKLVAATSIWANPRTVELLINEQDNPTGSWLMNVRRKKQKERRREFIEGCYLDDNTEPNKAIKTAIGERNTRGFTACHIYGRASCDDPLYFTAIPNLVLIPTAISSLTDYDENVIQALKYHSYALYGFYFDKIPTPPKNYPTLLWRPPMPYSDKIGKAINRRQREIWPKEN